jgi:hypothetical protein
MKDNPWKVFVVAAVSALVIYVVSFSWIQHRREMKGPWELQFNTDNRGVPSLIISQPVLNISNVTISFPEQHIEVTNLSEKIILDRPILKAPFGEVVFQDATFLPGTITYNFFGHGVELMPRVLIVDDLEISWVSATNIVITGERKFIPRPRKKPFLM